METDHRMGVLEYLVRVLLGMGFLGIVGTLLAVAWIGARLAYDRVREGVARRGPVRR